MLELSQSAADVLEQARQTQDIPEDYGVRIAAEPAPDGQASLTVGFAENPAEGDEVTEQAGTEVYIAEQVAGPLADSLIDVEQSEGGVQLVVKPQGQASDEQA